MKKITLITFLFSLLTTANALEMKVGGDTDIGNGGDTCEAKILDIRNDLSSWINAGGPEYLTLPNGLSAYNYSNSMLAAINSSVISCTTEELTVGQSEKTCKNVTNKQGSVIKCNFQRFQNTPIEEQYRLIHHEFAGVAGLETNSSTGTNYEESNYIISNQLAAFLEDVTTKKLVVKPVETSNGVTRVELMKNGVPMLLLSSEEVLETTSDDSLREKLINERSHAICKSHGYRRAIEIKGEYASDRKKAYIEMSNGMTMEIYAEGVCDLYKLTNPSKCIGNMYSYIIISSIDCE